MYWLQYIILFLAGISSAPIITAITIIEEQLPCTERRGLDHIKPYPKTKGFKCMNPLFFRIISNERTDFGGL